MAIRDNTKNGLKHRKNLIYLGAFVYTTLLAAMEYQRYLAITDDQTFNASIIFLLLVGPIFVGMVIVKHIDVIKQFNIAKWRANALTLFYALLLTALFYAWYVLVSMLFNGLR